MTTPEKQKVSIRCPHCGNNELGIVHGSYHYSFPEADVFYEVEFCECQHCQGTLVLKRDYDPYDEEYASREILYPEAVRTFGGKIPKSVKLSFEEAERCLDAQAFSASTLMCRRCLEAIAHDKGAKGRTLKAKLDSLKDAGILSSDLVEWSAMLRELGNEAAHKVDGLTSPVDARDVMDFTHALVEFVYSYRQRFDEFKTRKTAKPN